MQKRLLSLGTCILAVGYDIFTLVLLSFLGEGYVYSQRNQVNSAGTGSHGAVLTFDYASNGYDDLVAECAAIYYGGEERLQQSLPLHRFGGVYGF